MYREWKEWWIKEHITEKVKKKFHLLSWTKSFTLPIISTFIIWYFWSVRAIPHFILLDWGMAETKMALQRRMPGYCAEVPPHDPMHLWESTAAALIISHFIIKIRQEISFGMMNLQVGCVCVWVCARAYVIWLFCSLFMHHDQGKGHFFYLPKILPSTRDLTALNSVPDVRWTCLLAFSSSYKIVTWDANIQMEAVFFEKRTAVKGKKKKDKIGNCLYGPKDLEKQILKS